MFNTDGVTHEELIGQAESLVFKIGEKESRGKKTFTAIHELMTATLEKVHEISQGDGNTTGVPTGFYQLDEMTSGLQPSDLIIVAGRPFDGQDGFRDGYSSMPQSRKIYQSLFSAWRCQKRANCNEDAFVAF